MGLFSFVGGLLGGGKAKKASRKADAALIEYLNKGIAEQTRQFDITNEQFRPYLEAGTAALGQQGDLAGLNGTGVQASAIEALKASPLFASLFNTGEEAILQNASATGGLRGGDTQRSLADFGSDTLTKTILQQLGVLGDISGRGQSATGTLGALGANKADAITNLLGQQGQTKYSGLLTRGGITAGQFNSAGSFLDSILSAAVGAGAGPGGAPFDISKLLGGLKF